MRNEILDEINRRGITRLCHFVHTNKLLHILSSEEGIKAVNFIDEDILVPNDYLRLDGRKDYINCSIQFPNYWYYKKVKDNNPLFPDWAIIFIDPIVAAFDNTEFCPVNAAKARGQYIQEGYKGFCSIFEQNVGNQSRKTGMLECAPTDDQAEVLVYRNIERKYILGVAFETEVIARHKRAEWNVLGVPLIDIFIAPELFTGAMSQDIRRGKIPEEILYMEG